ncbi:MAG: SDR family oxidoreductase, partial [Porphyromonas sp.]
MNILVTGAGGQLGQELQEAVQTRSSQHTYHFADRASLDLTDASALEAYLEAHAIQLIINAAAYTAVDRAEDEPEKADLVNHQAVATLALLAKERDAFLLHVSTDYVFSGNAHTPYT